MGGLVSRSSDVAVRAGNLNMEIVLQTAAYTQLRNTLEAKIRAYEAQSHTLMNRHDADMQKDEILRDADVVFASEQKIIALKKQVVVRRNALATVPSDSVV